MHTFVVGLLPDLPDPPTPPLTTSGLSRQFEKAVMAAKALEAAATAARSLSRSPSMAGVCCRDAFDLTYSLFSLLSSTHSLWSLWSLWSLFLRNNGLLH